MLQKLLIELNLYQTRDILLSAVTVVKWNYMNLHQVAAIYISMGAECELMWLYLD